MKPTGRGRPRSGRSDRQGSTRKEKLGRLVALFREGQLEEAELLARVLTEDLPDEVTVWKVLLGSLRGLGKGEESVGAAHRIVALTPGDVEAHQNLAVLLAQSGQMRQAEQACVKALEVDSTAPGLHHLHATVLDALGRKQAMISALRSALALDPNQPHVELHLANALFSLGRLEEAVESYRVVVSRDPENSEGWRQLGTSLALLGRDQEAETSLRTGIGRQPDDVEARSNLGNLLRSVGRLDEAVEWCDSALSIDPQHCPAHTNLGNALLALGKLVQAEDSVRTALALEPDSFEANNTLGVILHRVGSLQESEASLRAAIELQPERAVGWSNLGMTLHDLGRLEEATRACKKALDLDPVSVAALNNLGNTLLALGRSDEAKAAFERALRHEPGSPSAILGLTSLRENPQDESAQDELLALAQNPDATPGEQMLLRFALGRMAAGAGDHATAFGHVATAHRARAKHLGHSYDRRGAERRLDDFRSQLGPEFFLERRDWALDTTAPIFVVGMPRSGTSLIEQILASHSLVYGAGEMGELGVLVRDLYQSTPVSGDWRNLARLRREDAMAGGRSYLESLARRPGAAARVVDKMPHNFESLWIVALLFPRATILHAARSPLDTCLSCYFQNFTRGHAYTDDLESLAHHYNYYRDLMAHWKAALPVSIHDIVYEQLVSDPEQRIPQLVETCGLTFEAQCLDFHETGRSVRTASLTEVRRAVYTSSVDKWKRYEQQLGPLIEALASREG